MIDEQRDTHRTLRDRRLLACGSAGAHPPPDLHEIHKALGAVEAIIAEIEVAFHFGWSAAVSHGERSRKRWLHGSATDHTTIISGPHVSEINLLDR
jgi:hypothetical protein